MAALKPASREMSAYARVTPGFCWARASSKTPTSSVRRRGLFGLGDGGIRTERVSTGAVALAAIVGIASVCTGSDEPDDVVCAAAVAVAVGAVDACVDAGVAGVSPSREETTRATASPAAAATARAAASRAFFTNPEATLARLCQTGSKSS
jgi:hypothetical protein